MIPLSLGGHGPARVRRVVLVGAHCDDVAIGAGATVLALARAVPDLEVRALVLTGGGTEREAEERAAMDRMAPQADLTVLDLPDGRLPDHRASVKDALQVIARDGADLVVAPQAADAHQDHRLLGELVPTSFRDSLHLGYEVLKWESDLPRTAAYLPVPDDLAAEKVRLIEECYPSQADHDWFDRESFLALMRIRGVQCHHRYAEAFCVDKLVLSLPT
ncbi:GlcNAc-PI de-N-acetylase [Marmoricola endophyticus]|uniref:GlcNAc-PI de-N-acetylase n=1 Tax=Marmoricola endophyticus TaxID=2040280 RepID=A0A917BCL0_9ACTN|nr:PIG-L family deacetylase [Marmoricola endophyticus]GGF35269.1 GlcNAc-PI de-N-acetylase [Marmoricola endophyticus]